MNKYYLNQDLNSSFCLLRHTYTINYVINSIKSSLNKDQRILTGIANEVKDE